MNDDKILNALKALQAGVTDVKQGQREQGSAIAQIKTALEAVKAGQDDIRDRMATEAVVMDSGAKIDRITRNHERRIEEPEKHAGLTDPHKN